jgi:hypothetical protein
MVDRPAALALAAAALVWLGGCRDGEDQRGTGPLSWTEPPVVQRTTQVRADRVLAGRVRNDSLRDLELDARELSVRDSDGRGLRVYAQFSPSFAHGLYGAAERPHPLPPEELRRLGLILSLRPGKITPLVVAFRVAREARPPLHIDYGKGLLPVPSRVAKQPGPG